MSGELVLGNCPLATRVHPRNCFSDVIGGKTEPPGPHSLSATCLANVSPFLVQSTSLLLSISLHLFVALPSKSLSFHCSQGSGPPVFLRSTSVFGSHRLFSPKLTSTSTMPTNMNAPTVDSTYSSPTITIEYIFLDKKSEFSRRKEMRGVNKKKLSENTQQIYRNIKC